MKVVFLNPATKWPYNYPHMGMVFLSSILKKVGYDISCFDGSAPYISHKNEDLVNECIRLKPNVICVTATTERAKFAYHLLCLLKNSLPDIPIVVGGPHATIRPLEMVSFGFDLAVIGPAENRIVKIIQAISNKDFGALEKISGIAFNMPEGGIKFNKFYPLEEDGFDIDDLLPADFSCFEEKDYIKKKSDSYRYGALYVGRGCPGRCIYCDKSVFGRNLKIASADKIVADMVSRRKKYYVDKFNFFDDTLLWNKKLVNELSDKIIACPELSGITWGCNARADITDQKLLAKMKYAGCNLIVLGVESGETETLVRIKKGINLETMLKAIDAILESGIKVYVNLMNGFPWQNMETIRAQISLVQILKKKGVSLISAGSTVFPFPGTELFKEFSGRGYPLHNWWLRDDFFEKNNAKSLYNREEKTPYYYKFVPPFCKIKHSEDFFGIYKDENLRKATESLLNDIQEYNLNNGDSRYLKHKKVRSLIKGISETLYWFSPSIEKWFWQKIGKIALSK